MQGGSCQLLAALRRSLLLSRAAFSPVLAEIGHSRNQIRPLPSPAQNTEQSVNAFWVLGREHQEVLVFLELLKALKAQEGARAKKLFQFLNEVGARALRMHIGRVLEMAESSTDKYAYENRIAERFGGQIELELVVPTPSVIPPAQTEERVRKVRARVKGESEEAAN